MPALDILAATRAPVWWGRVAITITADLLDVSYGMARLGSAPNL